jgi:hypothetical protein
MKIGICSIWQVIEGFPTLNFVDIYAMSVDISHAKRQTMNMSLYLDTCTLDE